MRRVLILALALCFAQPAAAVAFDRVGYSLTAQAPSQKGTVERIRLKYPTPLGARHWEFLVEVAQAVGGKLFRKDAGDSIVFVPPLNLTVSQDIIIVGAEWIDILGDGEGKAIPDWDANPNAGEPEKWIDVSRIVLPGGVTPPPPPPPTPDLVAKIDDIRSLLGAVHGESWAAASGVDFLRREVQELKEIVAELRAQVILLASHPVVLPPLVFPNYQAKILGQNVTLRPVK